jgi:hypothetical protein
MCFIASILAQTCQFVKSRKVSNLCRHQSPEVRGLYFSLFYSFNRRLCLLSYCPRLLYYTAFILFCQGLYFRTNVRNGAPKNCKNNPPAYPREGYLFWGGRWHRPTLSPCRAGSLLPAVPDKSCALLTVTAPFTTKSTPKLFIV